MEINKAVLFGSKSSFGIEAIPTRIDSRGRPEGKLFIWLGGERLGNPQAQGSLGMILGVMFDFVVRPSL